MITALRRFASTWIAKLLFVLLIVSFAVWGIGDVVQDWGRDRAVVRLEGDTIEVEEAQLAVQREMQRLMRQLGPDFEANEAIRNVVARQALERLIADRALRAEARRQDIAVPEEAVRAYVWAMPPLQGADGRFSRLLLDALLREHNLSEAEFLAMVRLDLARQQLLGAVRAGAAGPDAITRPLYLWAAEQRVADLAFLPLAEAPEPAEPEEEQLRRFHENNPDRFSAPEYREAVVAVLSAEALAGEVQVTGEELLQAYEARRDRFDTPERRALRQVVVQDAEAARAIAEAWRAGTDWPEIQRRAAELGGEAIELPPTDRAGLPLPELTEAAFTTPEGAVADPVQSPFGWHVLRVVSVEPATSRSFAEVREELRRELALEKAADLVYAQANRIEDALAGGMPLDEAAQRFGLASATVRIDASGRNPEGEAAALPVGQQDVRQEVVRRVFATQAGEVPRLQEIENGFVAVEVRSVIPPALRPFETVEDQVRQAWRAEARRGAQEERAAALLGAAQAGTPLPQAAREAGVSRINRVGPFPRHPAPENPLPPELLGPIFEAGPGGASMAETSEGFVVAQVAEVIPPDPDADPLALGRLREEVEQSMAGDLEQQYLLALRKRANVRINPDLFEMVAR